MANFVYATDASVRSSGLNFDFLGDFSSFSGSLTTLSWFDDPQNIAVLSGTGFAFTVFLGELIDLSGGTIQSLSVVIGGQPVVGVTGWSLDAATVFDLIVDEDDKGLRKLILGGDDVISLSNKKDNFDGGNGKDSLLGLKGDDQLSGGKGKDTLAGGADNDTLTGGKDADTFLFDAPSHIDTVTDFTDGEDLLLFVRSAFSGIGARGELGADRFALDAATTEGQRVIYETATGILRFDADGSGSGTSVVVAFLSAGLALDGGDILVG